MVVKRIYIAGPMSGLPDFNYPAFHAAAAALRALGHDVENPAENPPPACGSWQGYMRMSLRQISHCDALYMLPGWVESRGARLEHKIAADLGLALLGHMHEAVELERDLADEESAGAAGLVQARMGGRTC